MMPAPSSRVGRYVIVDRLGHGGMGVVYRAFDPELRRVVALKMLPGTNESPFLGDLLERFAREARSAAALTHPNIITVFDIGQDAGRPFIVMEFIEGETLGQLLKRHAPLSLTAKVHMALDLCAGLAFAHNRGVIHRDIKPANLMVTPDGVLKILDFGLARFMTELTRAGLTQAGTVLGTLLYMAPEQLMGRVADVRSDLYSVGAVLYELFTGRCPFDAENPAVVRMQILQDTPPPWAGVMSEPPAGLEAIVCRAMEKEPSARYQTLDELSAALKEQARELGIDTGPGALRSGEGAEPAAKTSDHLGAVIEGWERAVGAVLATSNHENAVPPTGWESTPSTSIPTTAVPSTPLLATPTPAPSSPASASVAPAAFEPPRPAPVSLPAAPPARHQPSRDFSRWIVAMAITAVVLAVVLAVLVARGWRQAPARPASVSAPSTLTPRPASPPTSPISGGSPAASRESASPPRVGAGAAPNEAPPLPAERPRPPQGRNRSEVPVNPRCAEILERAGLGEPLSKEERDVLSQQCRSGGE